MRNTKQRNYSSITSLENPVGFKVLILLCMIYMSIMICNAVLTNKYVGTDEFFMLGGTLTSPFLFIIDDIVAEIYGYKMARFMIITGFLAQTLFALICQFIIMTPYPTFFHEQHAYAYILGSSLLWINLSGCIAYLSANILNSYILTRWKVLIKGRKFWLRSLGSSVFSEGIYTLIAILLMEMKTLPLHNVLKVIGISYLIKIIYSVVFSFPSQVLVSYLKKITQIDVYDSFVHLPIFRENWSKS